MWWETLTVNLLFGWKTSSFFPRGLRRPCSSRVSSLHVTCPCSQCNESCAWFPRGPGVGFQSDKHEDKCHKPVLPKAARSRLRRVGGTDLCWNFLVMRVGHLQVSLMWGEGSGKLLEGGYRSGSTAYVPASGHRPIAFHPSQWVWSLTQNHKPVCLPGMLAAPRRPWINTRLFRPHHVS